MRVSGTQGRTVDNRLASVTKTDVTGTVLAVTKLSLLPQADLIAPRKCVHFL